jgi:MFS transporter, SP family, general alpha glucoside:H+ symporter
MEKPNAGEVEAQRVSSEHVYDVSDKSGAVYNKAGAIEAENEEHNMTVLEAVRAYPMATLWAFIMSCTIVSCSISCCFSRLSC